MYTLTNINSNIKKHNVKNKDRGKIVIAEKAFS